MEPTRLKILIEHAIANRLTDKEHEELLAYLVDPANKSMVEDMLGEAWQGFAPEHPVFTEEDGKVMLQEIRSSQQENNVQYQRSIWKKISGQRVWLAASLLLIASVSGYFLAQQDNAPGHVNQTLAEAVVQSRIEPGEDKAYITLADGRTVVLNEMTDGMIAEESGVHITKSESGEISYEDAPESQLSSIAYNTITIPKGGQYRLILSDGTKVHLNSGTTLRYPARFAGDTRKVELEGEAYFEVQHLISSMPFVIETATQQVEVLGTVFNVNTYSPGVVKTTLLEGKVRLEDRKGVSAFLNPGEMAVLHEDGQGFRIRKADLDSELAWHNGYFVFNEEGIKSIMDRVGRWYDVEIEYQGDLSRHRFGGIFQRSKSIVQLLENLKATGLVDFKISERRITVLENKNVR